MVILEKVGNQLSDLTNLYQVPGLHKWQHQKPGLTLSFSYALATILCFTHSISQMPFTQIAECKATL